MGHHSRLWYFRGCIIILMLTSCEEGPCFKNRFYGYTDYSINTTHRTPILRVRVDFSGQEKSLDADFILRELDIQTAEVLSCLGREYQDLSCLRIKIPANWYISPCTGEQLFPCDIPPWSCGMKGITPTDECPCACRAIIQYHDNIITTPNLKLYKGELVKLLTDYWNPWLIDGIKECL